MIILDTNVVSDLIRAAPDPGVRAWINSRPSTQIATTAITAAELYYGVARLPPGQRRQQLAVAVSALLNDVLRGRIAPFDERAAHRYADVVAEREHAGRTIGVPDAQIAAICRELGAVLATRNIKDFEETGVELVDPWQIGTQLYRFRCGVSGQGSCLSRCASGLHAMQTALPPVAGALL